MGLWSRGSGDEKALMKVESCGREGQVNCGAPMKLELGSRSSGGDR